MWDFDLCWRRWALGVEWGEGYFLFILGPMTFEKWWHVFDTRPVFRPLDDR